ncbi:hypothetical protein ACE193_21060 [Bernardetia sp. OM2101]|uniref:hypothetical protein n=1 Tax=Bernardetia sp. OM2101 TaxID=3344876 RepID=UPI0035CF1C97
MQKYLITSIILLVGLTSYLGYQNSIKNPVLEFTVNENTTVFIDGKFYDIIEENTTISNAPIGHYEMDYENFEVTQPNTTVQINYQ